VKTAQNSQQSKARNSVLLILSRAVRGESFRDLEACSLVTASVVYATLLGLTNVGFACFNAAQC
jgi:hypothetical protein